MFGKGGDHRLPFIGLDAKDVQNRSGRRPPSQKTGETVTHHAVRIDEQGGFAHAFTRCVALQAC